MVLESQDRQLLRQQCYVDGNWINANNGRTLDVTNPAAGGRIATVPDMGAAEARFAIAAATMAFRPWAAKTAKERAVILRRWFELMMEHQADLAKLMTAEQGKPLAEARGEIARNRVLAARARSTEFWISRNSSIYVWAA
jgi:succinate-semialdehyde dehydrogenase/glutarate-semialdehyde dehydrogenase